MIVNAAECPREAEVGRAVARPRGLACADAELRRHVDACADCADVVLLASLLRADRDEALREVRVPAAGQIWWRAALRAHAEASDAARRPLIWLQGIAAACAVALTAGMMSMAWPWMYSAAAAVAALRPDVAPLIDAARPILPIGITALACLVLTPLVVYFALSDE